MTVCTQAFIPIKKAGLSYDEFEAILEAIKKACGGVNCHVSYCLPGMWSFQFKDGVDDRDLKLFLDIEDTGDEVYKGQRILVSVNYWGNAEDIIRRVGLALIHFAKGPASQRGYWFNLVDWESKWEFVKKI